MLKFINQHFMKFSRHRFLKFHNFTTIIIHTHSYKFVTCILVFINAILGDEQQHSTSMNTVVVKDIIPLKGGAGIIRHTV